MNRIFYPLQHQQRHRWLGGVSRSTARRGNARCYQKICRGSSYHALSPGESTSFLSWVPWRCPASFLRQRAYDSPFFNYNVNAQSHQQQQRQRQHQRRTLSTTTTTTSSWPSATTSTGIPLDQEAVADLFHQYAKPRNGECCLDVADLRCLLRGIGEHNTAECDSNIQKLFSVADCNGDGVISVEEFLEHSATLLSSNPARIILVVGGPGSGKGVLSRRLEKQCNVVHLSSGDLLRTEVALGTTLGEQVKDIMARGELVSSAIMVTLMKKRMRDHPGKRVLLDGFPRSLENAHDLVTLCGKPELALHLDADDTVLMERIMERGATAKKNAKIQQQQQSWVTRGLNVNSSSKKSELQRREDDNFKTALRRLRTFHKYHHSTMEWLREQHVPVVNLDATGNAESVWQQLVAIGRLMRPAVKFKSGRAIVNRPAATLPSEHQQQFKHVEGALSGLHHTASREEDWSSEHEQTALF